MRNVKVSAIQMQCAKDVATNIQTAERLVRQAAEQGAQIILLPELFERPYSVSYTHLTLPTIYSV